MANLSDGLDAAFALREQDVHVDAQKLLHSSEAGSYLRLIDSCVTQLKAQGPSRTCNESKEEEEVVHSPEVNLTNNYRESRQR